MTYIRAMRLSVVALALLGTITRLTRVRAQSVAPEETVRLIRKMLERLPYYGVFDSSRSVLIAAPSRWSATATRRL